MSIKSTLSFFMRALAIGTPIAALAVSAGAAPVENLAAICSPSSILTSQTGLPQSCSSATAQATVTPTISFFGNGFTISIDEQGFATSVNGVPAGFIMSADVPVDVTIAGPSRPVVIKTTYSGEIDNLGYADGTIGEVNYGFSHLTAITKRPDGGVGQDLSFSYIADPRTVNAISGGADFSLIYGLQYSAQLDATITAGYLAAFVDLTNTVQIFEADGVTPVSLVSATPEPASALLILPGLIALYAMSRRARSNCQVK